MRRVLLLLLFVALVLAWICTGDNAAAPGAALPFGTDANATYQPAASTPEQIRRIDVAVPAGAVASARRYPIEREVVRLDGIVGDDYEQPVAGVAVTLRPEFGGSHPLLPIADDRSAVPGTTTDGLGRFRFERVAVGPCVVSARAADGRTAERHIVVTGVGEVLLQLGRELQPDLRVVVVDAAGNAVAGVSVQLQALRSDCGLAPADARPDRTAVTAGDGSCTFAAAPPEALVLTATAGGLAAFAILPQLSSHYPRDTTTLQLAATGSLVGELTGADGQLHGASMQALAMLYPAQAYYTGIGSSRSAQIEGSHFTFAALPAGRYALQLQSPRGLRLALPPLPDIANAVAPLVVEIKPGERCEVRAAVVAGGRIDGTVRQDDGTPVEGAIVTTVLVPQTSNYPDGYELHGAVVWRFDSPMSLSHSHPAAHQRARTDAAGHYELLALPDGRHRVEVFAAGLEFVQRTNVAVAAAPVRLDFALAAAGVLQGNLPGGSYLGVRRAGEATCCQIAILPDSGGFTFAGLAAGDYEVGKTSPDPSQFVVLARTHVDAGRTTWLDLGNAGPVRIQGVLRDGHGAPVQASVKLWSQRAQSRSDGSFELRLPWQLRRGLASPHLDVQVDGLRWQLPIPEAALAVDDWSGEFRLGGEQLVVQLVDADGAPLAGIVAVSGGQLADAHISLGADGAAVLRYLEPGDYTLSVTARDALVPSQRVRVPSREPLRLVAEPSTALEVLALDADGKPRNRAPVQIAVWRGQGPAPTDPAAWKGPWYGGTTDRSGRARITVPIGELLVSTLVWDTDVHQQQVLRTVRGAPAAVTLQLPR